MPEKTPPWQTIGWGGISFRLPPEWQPTIIFSSYLFFEIQGQPAFAVKWQCIQGRFTPERILNKLHKSLKPAGSHIDQWEIPQHLQKLLPTHSMTGFQWQENQENGRGILLFCPDCKLATLLQLYVTDHGADQTYEQILTSFVDHTESEEQLWSIYDVKAILPVQAKLTSHEFMVGRYTLTFNYKKTVLTLYRFKPAAALLANQTLTDFGQPLADLAPCTAHDDNSVTWSTKVRGARKLITVLKRKPVWIWLYLVHIPEKNVILGVKGTGKRPLDDALLKRIAANFSAV